MTLHAGKLLRIFLDEDERRDGRPLYMAVVQAFQAAGFTGATVLKGIEGFGGHRTLRSARGADTPTGLPVIVEVVDSEAKVLAFIPQLQAMIGEGLLTLESVGVMRIAGGEK